MKRWLSCELDDVYSTKMVVCHFKAKAAPLSLFQFVSLSGS